MHQTEMYLKSYKKIKTKQPNDNETKKNQCGEHKKSRSDIALRQRDEKSGDTKQPNRRKKAAYGMVFGHFSHARSHTSLSKLNLTSRKHCARGKSTHLKYSLINTTNWQAETIFIYCAFLKVRIYRKSIIQQLADLFVLMDDERGQRKKRLSQYTKTEYNCHKIQCK